MKPDEVNRKFCSFERRVVANQIAGLGEEIAATRREIQRFGPNEMDIEIIRLAEDARANLTIVLKDLDRKLKELESAEARTPE